MDRQLRTEERHRAWLPRSRSASRRGAILVGVLWVMVFVAFLAVVLRLHMSSVVINVRVTEDKAAARMLADAGLALAAGLVRAGASDENTTMPDTLTGSLETRSGSVSLILKNEAMRVDLNTAQKPLITGVLRAAGASNGLSDKLSDEILERRPDDTDPKEGENPSPTAPRQPKEAHPFRSVHEIALVRDMPEDVAVGMDRFVTVSSGLEGMRIENADPALLEKIPGLPRSVVQAIARYREGRIDGTELRQFLSDIEYNTADLAPSWRVDLSVELPSGHREAYEATIMVATEDELPYRVLDWRRLADDAK
ncbi:helix-hairpin-helix domain-containing protein [Aquibium oceanicum]|uniref:general secretion pathway protein GspK n=1 Tax=Aquibium oceanicum TaxID=1670800 RepID=UPI000AE7A2F6|nr:general secretion pathway protein GspK [Aquibium oceanicum]